MYTIQTDVEAGTKLSLEYTRLPDTCPICHTGIDVRVKSAYVQMLGAFTAEVIFQCPIESCRHFFVGYYSISGMTYYLQRLAPIKFVERVFSDEIQSISESFGQIYNEAHNAEEMGLLQICGAGYRKALEFLIKDYVIHITEDESLHEKIKSEWLGQVIQNRVTNDNVKLTASRATWLGNDEIHYVQLWTEMDINDLKTLIRLTVRWIEMEKMTQDYTERMPARDKHSESDTA